MSLLEVSMLEVSQIDQLVVLQVKGYEDIKPVNS